jgi:hypothetical protein
VARTSWEAGQGDALDINRGAISQRIARLVFFFIHPGDTKSGKASANIMPCAEQTSLSSGQRPNIPPAVADYLQTTTARYRLQFERRCQAIEALDAAPFMQKNVAARLWARRLRIRPESLFSLRSLFHKHGPVALINRRSSYRLWKSQKTRGLPPAFVVFLENLSTVGKLTRPEAHRILLARLDHWRNGDTSAKIPGYATPPQGNPPPGWTARNLVRHLAANRRAEVTIAFRSDGSTRIIRGKLASITRHPLYSVLSATFQGANA